jgi:TPR repeat protein
MHRIFLAIIFALASPAFAGMAELQAKANAGNAEAQYLMGYSYERGQNNPRNLELAAQWYQKAVSNNFARAQHRLGLMYATANGVPRDFSKTVALFEAAAKQKYPAAQMDYAMLLYSMAPPEYVNKPEAYAWFEVIKANYSDGYSSIRELHEKLEAQLLAEEVAAAKARGASYVEQYSP